MRGADFEATQYSKSNMEPPQIDRCISNESSPLNQDIQENNCSNSEPLISDPHLSLEPSTGFKIPDEVPQMKSQISHQSENESSIASPEPQGSSPEPNVIEEEAFSRIDENESRSWNGDSPDNQSIKANDISSVLTPYSSRRVSSTQYGFLEELRSAVGTAFEEWNEHVINSTNSHPVHPSKSRNWNEFRKLLELLKERRFDTEVSFRTTKINS